MKKNKHTSKYREQDNPLAPTIPQEILAPIGTYYDHKVQHKVTVYPPAYAHGVTKLIDD